MTVISSDMYNKLIAQIKKAIIQENMDSNHIYAQNIVKDLFNFILERQKLNENELILLKLFSYYVISQKAHLYNIGYFTEKITDFSQVYETARIRLKSIINNILCLSSQNNGLLTGKTICYDDLYSFEINGTIVQHVKINLNLFNNIFKGGPIFIRILNNEVIEFAGSYNTKELNEIVNYEKFEDAPLLKNYIDTLACIKRIQGNAKENIKNNQDYEHFEAVHEIERQVAQ